jgi:hypothetical protein
MTTVNGNTLAGCFSLVAACGKEINGLHDMLANMLVERFTERKESLPCVLAGKAINDARMDDSEWVCTDTAFSLPLKAAGRGKKCAEQYVGYQISMSGDGIAIPGNAEPLLHVFCWGSPCDFTSEYYAGFPHVNDDEDPCEIVCDRLMLWGSRNSTEWNKRSWCYSLRLVALNSQDDLKTYVVDPALALLMGGEVVKALPDSWLGAALICYPTREVLAEV